MRVGVDDVLATGRSQTTTTTEAETTPAEAEHEESADNAVEVELVERAINAPTDIYSMRSLIPSTVLLPG